MLLYAFLFLVVALVAAELGLGAVAGIASWMAEVLFVLALVLFIRSLVSHRRTCLWSLQEK